MNKFLNSKIYKLIFTISFLVYACIELASFKLLVLGKIGFILWVFLHFLLLVFTLKHILFQFRKKNLFTIIVVLLLILLVFIFIKSPKNISGESTQEIACALNHLTLSRDLGFWQTCLFGYPSRIFLVPALPSFFLGRTQFALNFGESNYIFLGLLLFSAGLMYHNKNVVNDIISSIVLLLLVHFNFFHYSLFAYQQSSAPFAISLMASGIFLVFLKKQDLESLLLLGFVVILSIFAHTPALALFGLFLAIIIYLIRNFPLKFNNKILLFSIIMYALIIFFLSLKIRGDLKFIDETYTLNKMANDILESFSILLFQKIQVMTPILYSISIIFMLLSLSLFFGYRILILTLWIIFTIIAAVILKGYIYYGVDYRLQRITLIIPILLLMIHNLVSKYISGSKIKLLPLIAFFLIILIIGLYNVYKYQNSLSASLQLNFINKLKSNEAKYLKKGSIFLISKSSPASLLSLGDFFSFFLPSSTGLILDDHCDLLKSKNSGKNLFVVADNKTSLTGCFIDHKNEFDFTRFLKLDSGKEIILYKKK